MTELQSAAGPEGGGEGSGFLQVVKNKKKSTLLGEGGRGERVVGNAEGKRRRGSEIKIIKIKQ